LSPLRLPIPPPGQDSVFTPDNAAKQALLVESPRGSNRSALASLHLPVLELLRPASQLVLQSEQLSALNRRQKFRELTLLTLNEIETLALENECLIEQLGDPVLICLVSRHDLLPQLAAKIALAREQSGSLYFELLIRRLQLSHLIVVQLQPLLHNFAGSLTESLLEHLASRVERRLLLLLLRRRNSRRNKHCKQCRQDQVPNSELHY
jgi:hypothetical protein